MLSAILTALQTSLTSSKSFLLASLLPALLFLAANVSLARLLWPEIWAWWVGLSGTTQALATSIGAAIALGLAVLLSMLSTAMLETLEGKRLLPFVGDVFSRALTRQQAAKLERIDRDLDKYSKDGRDIRQHFDTWITEMQAARKRAKVAVIAPDDAQTKEARKAVLRARELRLAGQHITYEEASAVVHGAVFLLENGASDADPAQDEALAAIAHARDVNQFERTRLYNKRQFNYPNVPSVDGSAQPVNVLAPTRLGNIGRTIQSYAISRYMIDVDILWTRIQHVISKSEKDAAALQDAKMQLDCCIGVWWLTVVYTSAWSIVLAWSANVVAPFVILWVAGPLLALVAYRLACERYQVWADLVRSSVDLFRFDLIRELALPLPSGVDEERRLWNAVSQQTGYCVPVDVSYNHERT